MDKFDEAFISFCETYNKLCEPTVKGGITSIGAYYPGATSSPPREHIRVSGFVKEALDMVPNQYMGFDVAKTQL